MAASLTGGSALDTLAKARRALDKAAAGYATALHRARDDGHSLAAIGRAAGVSRQAAWKATAGTAGHKRPRPATRQAGLQRPAAAHHADTAPAGPGSDRPANSAAPESADHGGPCEATGGARTRREPRLPFESFELSVRPAERFEVQAMIEAHYLGKWPGVVVWTLALCRNDVAVGVAVFALPPRETAKRYGGETWELARLWVHDDEPRNTETWFLARAAKLIRRTRPEVRYLVSYADPSVGHVGTVYKAANWAADGRTDEGRKTPRCDYLSGGKRYSRRNHVPDGQAVERVPRVSKARYVLAL